MPSELNQCQRWQGGRTVAAHEPGMVGGVAAVVLRGDTVVSGGWDAQVKTWDRQSAKLQTQTHTETWVYALSPISPVEADRLLVAATGGMYPVPTNLLRVFNLKTGKCEQALVGHRRGVHDAKVRGDWAASGSKDSLQLWHMPTVLEAKMTKDSQSQAPQVPPKLSINLQESDVRCVELAADAGGSGGWVALAPEAAPMVQVYDTETGTLKESWYTGKRSVVQATAALEAAPQPNEEGSTRLLFAGDTKRVSLWDLRCTSKEAHGLDYPGGNVRALKMASVGSGAGIEVAAGGGDGVLRIYDVRMWKTVQELDVDTRSDGMATYGINCIDMDATCVAFGTTGTELVIWDRKTGTYDFDGDLLSCIAPKGKGWGSAQNMNDLKEYKEEIMRIAERMDALRLEQKRIRVAGSLEEKLAFNKEFKEKMEMYETQKVSMETLLSEMS